jgi:hypothetical protein
MDPTLLLSFWRAYAELINYTQPVYVWREDPNSRQNTIKEIIERTHSKEDWPQVSGIVREASQNAR